MNLDYFQLVDRIIDLRLDERIVVIEARIPETSTIFEGHFPGYPLMPGVLLIEAMAQSSGWLIVGLNKFKRMAFLAAVKEAKLRQFISPGHTLTITARMAHEGSGFAITETEIHVGGKLTCNATLTFRHTPFPNAELRGHMLAMAKRVGFPQLEQVAGNV